MPINYSMKAKTARMAAVRDLLNDGLFTLYNDAGQQIASYVLQPIAGEVLDDTVTLAGFPQKAASKVNGAVASAKLFARAFDLVVDGLTTNDFTATGDKLEVGSPVIVTSIALRHF